VPARGHGGHVAGVPDVAREVGAGVKPSVSSGQCRLPVTVTGPRRGGGTSFGRHEAAVDQDAAAPRSRRGDDAVPAPCRLADQHAHVAGRDLAGPRRPAGSARLGVGVLGQGTGAAAMRASISASTPSFQASRCTCQTPSDTRIATPPARRSAARSCVGSWSLQSKRASPGGRLPWCAFILKYRRGEREGAGGRPPLRRVRRSTACPRCRPPAKRNSQTTSTKCQYQAAASKPICFSA
jgi:hypothetical protein